MRISDWSSDGCSSDRLLVAGLGWLDDHRPLSPWSRLAVHAVAACLLGLVAVGAGGHVAAALFAFVLAMVLVTIWNFMDGIEGDRAGVGQGTGVYVRVDLGGCRIINKQKETYVG